MVNGLEQSTGMRMSLEFNGLASVPSDASPTRPARRMTRPAVPGLRSHSLRFVFSLLMACVCARPAPLILLLQSLQVHGNLGLTSQRPATNSSRMRLPNKPSIGAAFG